MSSEIFTRAQQSVANGDYASAKTDYEILIEEESNNSAAWYGLGVVNHALGDTEAAIVSFERAFLINRFHAPTAANLAFLFSERDLKLASKYATAAKDLGLSNEQLVNLTQPVEVEEGRNVAEEPPLISAESIVIEEPENDEDESEINNEILELIGQSEYGSAMEIISPALEGVHSSNPEIWFYCGLCLSALGLNDDAIQSLNYCLELDPQYSEAYDLIESIEQHTQGELENESTHQYSEFTPVAHEEVKYAEYVHEKNEDDTLDISLENTLVVLQRKAKEASNSGNHTTAIQTWKKIIEECGSTPDSWTGMAEALESAGHMEKARQCRDKAEELQDTKSPDNISQISVDLIAAAEEVKLSVERNTHINEESVNVAIEWYNKGLTLLGEDKGDQALNCFDKAISSAPREEKELRVRCHNGRGHALHQLGRFSDSIQSYHQAISMDPTMVSGRTLYNMGSSYAAMEHFSDAIKCFEQALSRELDEEETRLCQTQMNRCSLLLKEQIKSAKLQS